MPSMGLLISRLGMARKEKVSLKKRQYKLPKFKCREKKERIKNRAFKNCGKISKGVTGILEERENGTEERF